MGILRNEIKQLESQLNQVTTQLSEQQQINSRLGDENAKLKNHQQFLSVAKGKVDPDYVDVVWQSMSSTVKSSDSGLVVGDRPLSDALDDYLQQYPRLAVSSSGANQSRSDASAPKGKPVIERSAFVDNLDAIISGDVELT